jgi:hypothetical protein
LIDDWSLLEVLIAALFGSWFLLSLAGQLWPRDTLFLRSPLARLVPDWRFFAPEPAVEDRVVVYRFKSAADETGPLQTVVLPRTGARRWLWNPENRRRKAFFDLTDGLQRLVESLNKGERRSDVPDALMLTEPYLVLLNVVSARRASSDGGLVQFGIIERGWPDHEELVFLSRWHTLEPLASPAAQVDRIP